MEGRHDSRDTLYFYVLRLLNRRESLLFTINWDTFVCRAYGTVDNHCFLRSTRRAPPRCFLLVEISSLRTCSWEQTGTSASQILVWPRCEELLNAGQPLPWTFLRVVLVSISSRSRSKPPLEVVASFVRPAIVCSFASGKNKPPNASLSLEWVLKSTSDFFSREILKGADRCRRRRVEDDMWNERVYGPRDDFKEGVRQSCRLVVYGRVGLRNDLWIPSISGQNSERPEPQDPEREGIPAKVAESNRSSGERIFVSNHPLAILFLAYFEASTKNRAEFAMSSLPRRNPQ